MKAAPAFRRVVGLMSGTSLDGLDLVLVAFHGDRMRLEGTWSVGYPAALRARLLQCATGAASAWDLGHVHHDLGRWYAKAAGRSLAKVKVKVEALGLHGQTVFHRADPRSPATLQIGEPAYLAAALGVPVVSNFRAMDIASGGQGAPLATLFHVRAFARRGEHVCVQNLGGIGNVTSIDWREGREPRVMAFDTGPANMLMDAAMVACTGGRQSLDRDGRWALKGTASDALVGKWVARDRFVRARPPKSTGRERYGAAYLEGLEADMATAGVRPVDRMATLTAFTAATVAENYARHLPAKPGRVVLCGGGSRNPALCIALARALESRLGTVPMTTSDEVGWPSSAVEGAAFALLARERLLERAGTLPETTGACRAVVCGQVTLP